MIKEEWEDPTFYYRYDGYDYIYLSKYSVTSTTPKGVWLSLGITQKDKFVLNNSHKRWALPTIELAQESFRKRKIREVKILRAQLDRAERALKAPFEPAPKAGEFSFL